MDCLYPSRLSRIHVSGRDGGTEGQGWRDRVRSLGSRPRDLPLLVPCPYGPVGRPLVDVDSAPRHEGLPAARAVDGRALEARHVVLETNPFTTPRPGGTTGRDESGVESVDRPTGVTGGGRVWSGGPGGPGQRVEVSVSRPEGGGRAWSCLEQLGRRDGEHHSKLGHFRRRPVYHIVVSPSSRTILCEFQEGVIEVFDGWVSEEIPSVSLHWSDRVSGLQGVVVLSSPVCSDPNDREFGSPFLFHLIHFPGPLMPFTLDLCRTRSRVLSL